MSQPGTLTPGLTLCGFVSPEEVAQGWPAPSCLGKAALVNPVVGRTPDPRGGNHKGEDMTT